MYRIYPNYRVDTRGPVGILREIIARIWPALDHEILERGSINEAAEAFFHGFDGEEVRPGKECQAALPSPWQNRAQGLWRLLDDIDTLGDQLKPERTQYFDAVCRLAARRYEMLKSDGHALSEPDPPAPPVPAGFSSIGTQTVTTTGQLPPPDAGQ